MENFTCNSAGSINRQQPPHEALARAVTGAIQQGMQAAHQAGQRAHSWAQQHLQLPFASFGSTPGSASDSRTCPAAFRVQLSSHHQQQQQQQQQQPGYSSVPCCDCTCARQSSAASTAGNCSSIGNSGMPPPTLLASLSAAALVQPASSIQSPADSSAARKAELGRCTWLLLHMLAAQYPEKPTRQQKRDVREFVSCLTRIYPCGQCASHFMQIVKRDPPAVNSRQELQSWTCRVHNVVNRSLGKPEFNCDVAAARWAPLDCGPDDSGPVAGCDMTVGKHRWR